MTEAVDLKKSEATDDYCLCPRFTKTFSFLGKKWNGLIIDVILDDGPQRFKDLARHVPKCSDRVLVERLKELEQMGIITRQTFPDSALIQYDLTEKGRELKDVMAAVHLWSEKWWDEDTLDAVPQNG
ncbi:winged helix-turn-helix transcriptional regulator [Levilactobacillus bambusae]|uniref:Transcriptional regulator n=1 Tax=Levilactobacillus bambusae TaxID=2024736 RepID=A0A2V1N166_9LACO|nr:helix-turn-helix domain-containing protein [Levilactobacillus bambusae]PWG01009.1 transcriptional regulator [Levilactobacillus bambusae]